MPGYAKIPVNIKITPTKAVILLLLMVNCNKTTNPKRATNMLQCLGQPLTYFNPQAVTLMVAAKPAHKVNVLIFFKIPT